MAAFSTAVAIPPARDAAWVVRAAIMVVAFGWAGAIVATTSYLAWAEWRLADAASRGLWEASLPKGSLTTARREIVRQLSWRGLRPAQLTVSLWENGRPVSSLERQPGSIATLQLATPAAALLPDSLRRLTLLTDSWPLLARARRVYSFHQPAQCPD